MGRLSTTYANKILDALLGSGHASGMPATVYVGLRASGVEPSSGSYARVAVTNNDTNWPAASGRSKANGTVITFPAPTGAWGTIDEAFLSTASSGGTEIIPVALAVSRTVDASSSAPVFGVGTLVFTVPT